MAEREIAEDITHFRVLPDVETHRKGSQKIAREPPTEANRLFCANPACLLGIMGTWFKNIRAVQSREQDWLNL